MEDLPSRNRAEAVHGHEQPPRRVACIARPVLAGDLASDGRLDPVRADQEVSRDPLPAVKLQRDASRVFAKSGGRRVQADAAGLQLLDARRENRVVVGPVKLEIGRAVALPMGGGERQRLQHLARIEQAELRDRRPVGQTLQRFENAQMTQHMGGVGALLNARADLAQLRSLLVDLHLNTENTPPPRAPDSGAGDQNSSQVIPLSRRAVRKAASPSERFRSSGVVMGAG